MGTETTSDFSAFAGDVVFPRQRDDLTDTTRCPACLTPLASSVCDNCALDLSHPAALELAESSRAAARYLDHRVALIGQIRHETAARSLPASAGVPEAHPTESERSPADTRAEGTDRETATSTPPAAPPITAHPSGNLVTLDTFEPASELHADQHASEPEKPRRSSIQVTLVVLGVALLSVAAIFFLVFAVVLFNLIGLIGQSIIVAAATAAAYAAASLLRRRKLNATAEGIAVFAVVLTYLDVYAIRANDLFGTASVDPLVHWGSALILSSAGFAMWNRASLLRTPSIVAACVWPIGVGVFAGGLSISLAGTTPLFIGMISTAAAALFHPVTARISVTPGASRGAERILMIAAGGVALVLAAITAFSISAGGAAGSVCALVLVAAVAAGHARVALIPSLVHGVPAVPSLHGFALSTAALSSVALALTGAAYAAHVADTTGSFFWTPLIAATVAVAADVIVSRRNTIPAVTATLPDSLNVARIASAAVAGLAVLLPLYPAVVNVVAKVAAAVPALVLAAPTDVIPITTVNGFPAAIAALASISVITIGGWALVGMPAARRTMIGCTISITAIVSVGIVASAAVAAGLWLVLGVAAVFLVSLYRGAGATRSTLQIVVASAAAVATILGFVTSWSDPFAWIWASIGTVVVLLIARRMLRPLPIAVGATLIGGVTVVTLIAAGAWGHLSWEGAVGVPFSSPGWLRYVTVASLVALAASSVRGRLPLTPTERRAMFWISATTSAGTVTAPAVFASTVLTSPVTVLQQPVVGVLLGVAVLGALLLWALPQQHLSLRIERRAASVALAPITTCIAVTFSHLIGRPEFASSVAPATAALLVGAGSFAASRSAGSARAARDIGIAIVLIPTVLIAVGSQSFGWLVLVIAAVCTLFFATSSDGIFSSTSPRRYLGWLSLGLAVSGLWLRLAEVQVSAVEFYVLPVAAVLLILAGLAYRSERRRTQHDPIPSHPTANASYIFFAGLLVALLPIGAVSVTGDPLRALVVGSVSALLALFGTFVMGISRFRPFLDAAAAAGAVGVATVTLGRATALSLRSDGEAGPELDAWLGFGSIVLLLAAGGLLRVRGDAAEPIRQRSAEVTGVVVFTAVLILEIANFSSPAYGGIRAVAVVLLFAIVHVLPYATSRTPFTTRIGWMAIAYAGGAAAIAIVSSRVEPLEILTVPIAIALAATGLLALERFPSARSWPYLGPATLVLLVPTLLGTALDGPILRLVVLGVVATAIVVIGVLRRLQAPFVVGSVVLLIHAIATFSDGIRVVYLAVPWWLWLAAGGILLIVLAARYERQVRTVRTMALKVASLR